MVHPISRCFDHMHNSIVLGYGNLLLVNKQLGYSSYGFCWLSNFLSVIKSTKKICITSYHVYNGLFVNVASNAQYRRQCLFIMVMAPNGLLAYVSVKGWGAGLSYLYVLG